MELLLLRHGPAGDKAAWKAAGKPDHERPLTSKGAKKTRKAVAGLASAIAGLDAVVTSPLVRARQTAEILRQAYRSAAALELHELSPGTPAEALASRLRGLGKERVALVGHEPDLGAFAGWLLGCPELKLELKKAGACLLSLDEPKAGAAALRWLLKPSQLRALA
jgi:phosphohistidine phosphatase